MPRASVEGRQAVVAPAGTVCRKCWHGLRGLTYGSVCPECGMSIGAGMDPLWWGNGPLPTLLAAAGAARRTFWVTMGGTAVLLAIGVFEDSMSKGTGGPGPLHSAIVITSLIVWSVYLAAIGHCMLALRRARLVSSPLCLVVITGAGLSVAGAAFSVIQSLWNERNTAGLGMDRPQAVLTVGFAISTLSTLLLWSVALRQAAVRIGNTSLRAWGLMLVGFLGLLLLTWIPTAVLILQSAFSDVFVLGMVRGRPWIMVVMDYTNILLPFVIIPSFVLLIVNPHLLQRALRRFIAARGDAS